MTAASDALVLGVLRRFAAILVVAQLLYTDGVAFLGVALNLFAVSDDQGLRIASSVLLLAVLAIANYSWYRAAVALWVTTGRRSPWLTPVLITNAVFGIYAVMEGIANLERGGVIQGFGALIISYACVVSLVAPGEPQHTTT